MPGFTQKGLISRQQCVTDEATVREALTSQANTDDLEDYIAKMKMSVFFKQVPTFRSDELLDRLAQEYGYAKRIIDNCAADGYWPRTFQTRDCPQCPLRELCMADLQGGDVESLMETTYRRRGDEAEPRVLPPADYTEGGVE